LHFEIQTGRPFWNVLPNEEREDLSSAMKAVFFSNTEDAILIWNWVPVKINYNADLSVMMEDLLVLLKELLKSPQGSTLTRFGASTFRAHWSATWSDGKIRIDASWHSVAGSYEDLLNSRHILEIPCHKFLSEWKALLRKVSSAIEESEIKIEDKNDLFLLREVESAIPEFGCLYREHYDKPDPIG
jgi:hypothetical protein